MCRSDGQPEATINKQKKTKRVLGIPLKHGIHFLSVVICPTMQQSWTTFGHEDVGIIIHVVSKIKVEMDLSLSILSTTPEASVDSEDQDQTAQNVQSDL